MTSRSGYSILATMAVGSAKDMAFHTPDCMKEYWFVSGT